MEYSATPPTSKCELQRYDLFKYNTIILIIPTQVNHSQYNMGDTSISRPQSLPN